ncbi:MAG: hypothetical protein ACOCWA_06390 [Bacteroidota bacterium]
MKSIIKVIFRLVIAVVFIFTAPKLFAQPYTYTSIEDVDILEQQKDVLRQKYKHTFEELEILGGYRLDEIHTMIAYKKDGVYHEAILNSERKEMMLVSTAAEIPVSDVPKPVMSAFENSGYSDKEINKAFRVNTPFGEDFIRLDIKKDETVDRLYYTELGARQKELY